MAAQEWIKPQLYSTIATIQLWIQMAISLKSYIFWTDVHNITIEGLLKLNL